MKILVYTAIFGDKDQGPSLINKDLLPDLDIRFVYVSDNPHLKSSDYEFIYQAQRYSDVTKNARYVKVNGLNGMAIYDIAIWHDSSIMLDCARISEIIEIAANHTLSTFKHVQHSVYSEDRKCIELGKVEESALLARFPEFPLRHDDFVYLYVMAQK